MARQLDLFCSRTEAELFHDHQKSGFFSLLVQLPERKCQSSHLLSDLPRVLDMIAPNRDTWISQAEFTRPNRRVVNLLRIGLLFADLDTYRMSWATGRTPEELASAVLYHCLQEGIPAPSILIYSGRGIQAKWLLDVALPRQALPRWNACQRYLVDRLTMIGADPAAKDASRVLRLIDTINSKSGEVCRVVHVENGKDGTPIRYNFEYLAETLLPTARWEIEQQHQVRAKRRRLKLMPGTKTDNLRGFSGRQLAWDRLEDLRKLSELRGGVPEGERMKHLFWRLNFLMLSGATHSGQMYYEASALAAELAPSWNYRSKELMTLYAKAKQFEAGERVEFGGKEFPPLYTPRNNTMISLFQITDLEQQALRTLISGETAAKRHAEREQMRRRTAGAVDRATYLEAASNKQIQALSLKKQGLSVRAIALQMEVSAMAVSRYLKPL
jgi:DNA-binding CsgD family transcriptional regulator